jgi:PHD/YefM family antitoxin component YafN of YafNO toxin-antitoxin module
LAKLPLGFSCLLAIRKTLAKMAIRSSAMTVTATEAKNKFGAMCAKAKVSPVFVEKDGRLDTVILSIEQFDVLKRSAKVGDLDRPSRQFEKRYSSWLKEQNDRFEVNGLWCDDLRTW